MLRPYALKDLIDFHELCLVMICHVVQAIHLDGEKLSGVL